MIKFSVTVARCFLIPETTVDIIINSQTISHEVQFLRKHLVLTYKYKNLQSNVMLVPLYLFP